MQVNLNKPPPEHVRSYVVTVEGLGTVCVAKDYAVALDTWQWYAALAHKPGSTVYNAQVKMYDPWGFVTADNLWNNDEDGGLEDEND